MKKKVIAMLLLTGILATACATPAPVQNPESQPEIQESEGQTDHEAEVDTEESDHPQSASEDSLSFKFFSVSIPKEWEGLYEFEEYERESDDESGYSYSVSFVNTKAKEANWGGHVMSIVVAEDHPEWIDFIGGDAIGILTDKESGKRYFVATQYPTDVQFDPEDDAEYKMMAEDKDKIIASFQAADGYEFKEATYAEMMSDYERSTDAVIVDAAMNSLLVQNQDGMDMLYFNYGEDFDRSTLPSIVLGHPIKITYTGVIDGDSFEDAQLVSIESAEDQYDYDYEAAEAAGQILLAADSKNMEFLADLSDFPITIDEEEIKDKEEFLKYEYDDIFSEELDRFIKYASLTSIETEDDKAVFSILPEYSHIVLKKTDDGWKLKEIWNIPTEF